MYLLASVHSERYLSERPCAYIDHSLAPFFRVFQTDNGTTTEAQSGRHRRNGIWKRKELGSKHRQIFFLRSVGAVNVRLDAVFESECILLVWRRYIILPLPSAPLGCPSEIAFSSFVVPGRVWKSQQWATEYSHFSVEDEQMRGEGRRCNHCLSSY